MSDTAPKWQPVVIVLKDRARLECSCGALAVFVTGKRPEDGEYNQLEEVDVWCQACFVKAQEEEE